jgi:type VI secretion system protein VasD
MIHVKSLMKLIIGAMLLTLSGCAWWHKVPVVQLQIQAAHYLNPNIKRQASPVVLTVFQLKNNFAFKQAPYALLLKQPMAVLGDSLIDKTRIEIRPSQRHVLRFPLTASAQYLGVMAGYRHLASAKWRQVVMLKPNQSQTIRVFLQSNGLFIDER